MEIKNSVLSTLNPYNKALIEQKQGDTAERAAAQAPPAMQGDRVSLSDEARLLTVARAEASAAPEVRREEVDALKQSIADGTYTVDSRKIAMKLIAAETQLAGTLEE